MPIHELHMEIYSEVLVVHLFFLKLPICFFISFIQLLSSGGPAATSILGSSRLDKIYHLRLTRSVAEK